MRLTCLLALIFALPVAADAPPVVVVQSPPLIVQQPPTVYAARQMPAKMVKTVTYTLTPGEVVYVAVEPKRPGLLARLKAKLCCGN